MRILHLDAGRQMRGGQWQAMLLMRALRDKGHQCVLAARPDGPLLRQAAAEQFPVAPLSVRLPSADIAHAHDARSHTIAAVIRRQPLVVSRRVAFPVKTGLLSRWKYRHAAHYIAISERVKRCLIEAGVLDSEVTVVYDAVPLPDSVSTRAGAVVAIDSSDPQKGGGLARRAAELAGVPVVFTKDLVPALARASLFLHISDEEGLGSAALLAMAAGVPVIASRVGGLPEAIADGVTGILVANEAEEIAGAIRRLLNDPELARRMGEAGRARVAERFSIENMLRGTMAVYDRVLR